MPLSIFVIPARKADCGWTTIAFMTRRKPTNESLAFGKQLASVDTYYVGKDTFVGELPALRLLTQEYADKEDAGAALDELRGQFPSARICDWQDLFDIDNPKEVIDDAEKIAAARKEQRHAAAKKAVVETLARMIDGKEVPPVLTTFLIKCWAPLMAHYHLEQGEQSSPWSDAVHTLSELIEAAQPKLTWLELEQIFGEIDLYFDNLKQSLRSAPTFRGHHDEELDSLWNWYRERAVLKSSECSVDEAGDSSPVDQHSADYQDDAVADSSASHEQPEPAETQSSQVHMPREVVVGNWFELYMGEGKPKRHLKLIRIDHETPCLMFSDSKGRETLEVDLRRFLEDLSEGKTAMIQQGNQFDQALSQVIGSIRNQNDKRLSA